MKISAWIVVCGLALGVASVSGMAVPRAVAAAPMDEKVDLTPKYKAGQKFTFKQHTVRTDTMTLGNVPKPEEKPGAGGEEPKKETPEGAPGEKPRGAAGEGGPTVAGIQPASPAKDGGAAQPSGRGGSPTGGGGMSSTQKVEQTATYELRVVSADDKGVQVELELKSVSATAELAGGKVSWDSSAPPDDKDPSNPVLQAYRPVVGAVTKMTLGPNGNVTSVQPDERVATAARGPLAPMIQQLVGQDGVRLRWSAVLWIKDGHEPASVGQTWTNVDESAFPPVNGKFVYETRDTLKGVSGGVATIDIAGDVKLEPLDAAKPVTGKVKDGTIKGSCAWDVAAGVAKSHTWEQNQTLDVNAMGIAVLRRSELKVVTTRE